jgi:NAD(P)H-flavin reductase/formate hydrogenlyase subunit 6/NADH:ubiquinone oxidoreductase subunit I
MILKKERLTEFISLLQKQKKRIIAPAIYDGDIQFREISDPEEITLEFSRTFESLKAFFLPHTETLFAHDTEGGGVSIHASHREMKPMIIFGVPPCDLHAIHQMPLIYHSHEPILQERIDRTIFVCFNCSSTCTKSSFCSSLGTGPFYHGDNADIVLTDLGEAFLIEGRTDTGRSLLQESPGLVAPPSTDDYQRMDRTELLTMLDQTELLTMLDRIENQARSEQTISFDPTQIGSIMREDDPLWDEKARDCFRCGGCNYICPTCVCYDVNDRGAIRDRTWDSCLMNGFTMLAGGNNPRGKLSQRIAQRYLHKFVYSKVQSGFHSCVGCGRCTDICLFSDNMGETIADMIQKGGTRTEEGSGDMISPGMGPVAPGTVQSPEDLHLTMIPKIGTLMKKVSITDHDALFTIALPEPMEFRPGQFVEVGVFGTGEVPISIASRHRHSGLNVIELVIRDIGAVTHAIHQLHPGSVIGIRGPYGTSWPLDGIVGRHIHVIAGGVGLCPLRGAIIELRERRSELKGLDVYYGARDPSQRLFRDELGEWGSDMSLHQTVDSRSGQDEWSGDIGLITQYFRPEREQWGGDVGSAMAFICGPLIMMKHVCRSLETLGFDDRNIYVSLEAMMKCGVGTCGHCTLGELCVCSDGPVFSLHRLKGIHGIEYPF